MAEKQPDQVKQPTAEDTTTDAADDYQTPIEESNRKTGAAVPSNAKSTAAPESGSSDTQVEGSPNQGTEKR